MLVQDIMTKNVITVSPDTSLKDAVEKMKKHNIGGLPVKSKGLIVGFLTDRDILIRGYNHHGITSVRQIMSTDICYCFSNQNIKAAVSTMGQLNIRRLPVLNDSKHLVGMLSLSDLTKSDRVWHEVQPLMVQYKMSA